MNPPDETPNPILASALNILEGFAPGFLDDPEKAMRDLVPRLRFLVIDRVETPTIPQLEALRVFEKDSGLIQLQKQMQAGEVQFGPFPGDLAELAFVPKLSGLGFKVSLRNLTEAEERKFLESDNRERR